MTGDADVSEPRVWVVRAGKGGRNASDFERSGLIAIGFAEAGDPTGLDRDELFAQVREAVGSRGGHVAGQVDRFARVMSVGDLVIVPDGSTRELLCGRITGAYEYRSEPPIAHFRHVRTVSWIGRRDRDLLPDRVLFTLGSLLAVFLPAQQDLLREFAVRGVVERGVRDGGESSEVGSETSDADGGTSAETSAADQEARNRELIAKRIGRIGGYETQDLVAGVLKALGYTTKVAAPGADGGVDIEACKDALFLQPPLVKAQVKARPGTKTGPDEIRQLNGLFDRVNERGIFISTGGFTASAIAEARQMQIHLWDLERLTDLFLENYSRLPEAVQDLVPLRQIWALEDADEVE